MPTSTIGQQIRLLREARNWTQADLAARMQVPPRHIGHWETGYRRPSMDACVLLADALEVSLDTLIRGSDPNARPASSGLIEAVFAR